MRDNKYYTPETKEFHVGFEYQFKVGDKWADRIVSDTTVSLNNPGNIANMIADDEIRVKYLDEEDIKSQDFVIQQSTWDRQSLKRTVIKYVPHPSFGPGHSFEKVINETLVWQVFWNAETGHMIIVKAHNENKRRLVWSEPKDKKKKTPPEHFMDFDELFKGIIKNKSEFKRILRQTGIVK